jgi:hypothetical protein
MKTTTAPKKTDVKQLQAPWNRPDPEIEAMAGEHMDEDQYELLVRGDADVYKPNGDPLIKYRTNVIPKGACRAAFANLKKAAKPTDNRGNAAGKVNPDRLPGNADQVVQANDDGTKVRLVKEDGTVSKQTRSNEVNSGIVGYFDRYPRIPYCRETAFTIDNREKFEASYPFFRACDRVFERNMPDRYQNQMQKVKQTPGDFVINDTAFTTVTVNTDFRTALHTDDGDLEEGFGVMSVIRSGQYDGCFLTWPKYGVAVDMQTADVCLADVHEWHGNTPLYGTPGTYTRLATVLYYRRDMIECENKEQELERAKELRNTLDN